MPNGMYGGVRGGLNSPYSIVTFDLHYRKKNALTKQNGEYYNVISKNKPFDLLPYVPGVL